MQKKSRNKNMLPIAGVGLLIVFITFMVFFPMDKPSPPQQLANVQPEVDEFEFKKQGEVIFISADQKHITKIDVEIAEDADKRALGLMYREKLEDQQGMLFIFRFDQMISFWMKNTKISLDMLFIDSRNTIVTIHENTVPYSEEGHESTEPAKYVVEVKAGFVKRHRIKTGDRIQIDRL